MVVYDELEHGAELTYDEKIGVPEEDIQRMLTPKDQLAESIFGLRAKRLGREHRAQAERAQVTRSLTTEECRRFLHMEQCP